MHPRKLVLQLTKESQKSRSVSVGGSSGETTHSLLSNLQRIGAIITRRLIRSIRKYRCQTTTQWHICVNAWHRQHTENTQLKTVSRALHYAYAKKTRFKYWLGSDNYGTMHMLETAWLLLLWNRTSWCTTYVLTEFGIIGKGSCS